MHPSFFRPSFPISLKTVSSLSALPVHVTALGRARRRQAVMQHLSKKNGSACSSPDPELTATTSDAMSQRSELSSISQGDDGMEGATNLPAPSDISSGACDSQNWGARHISEADPLGSVSLGAEGEGSLQSSFLADSSASSFFSAVSSVSRHAWQSMFGGQMDDSRLEVSPRGWMSGPPGSPDDGRTAGGELDHSSHVLGPRSMGSVTGKGGGGDRTKTDVDMKAMAAELDNCSASQRESTGKGDFHRSGLLSPLLHASPADAFCGKEGVKGHVDSSATSESWDLFSEDSLSEEDEEEGWVGDIQPEAFAEVDDRPAQKSLPAKYPNLNSVLHEDFPPLTQAAFKTVHTGTPPAFTRDSLQAIAVSILEPTTGELQDRKGPEESPAGFEAGTEGGASVSSRLPGTGFEGAAAGAESDFGAYDVYISEEDEVPSDWEDRDTCSAASLGSKENVADIYEGTPGSKSVGERRYCGSLSAGEGFSGGTTASTQLHTMNASGDGTASKLSPPSDRFGLSSKTGGCLGSHGQLADTAEEEELPFPRESNSPPVGGRPLSPVSTPPQGATSPGGGVQYERGDLAFMAKEKGSGKPRGGKKQKFRPFDMRQVTMAEGEGPREKWLPKTITCTNCGEQGHMPSDCPQPRQHLLF